MRRALPVILFAVLVCAALALAVRLPGADPRMKGTYRRAPQDGWTFVHLEGAPAEVGFQHGFLLAREIKDGVDVQKLELLHDSKKARNFYRDAARDILWPHIPDEYRAELQGISAGMKAAGTALDLWDVVALNASMEWSYYIRQYDKQHGLTTANAVTAPDHCSAFVATGSYTKDGKFVVAHNNWTSYMDGQRWMIAFDVTPARGHHFVMDGYPGLIHAAWAIGSRPGMPPAQFRTRWLTRPWQYI